MKTNLLIPFAILLALTVGCSRISDLTRKSENTNGTGSTNSETQRPDDPDPSYGEYAPGPDAKADLEKLTSRFMAVTSFKATMNGEGQTPMRTVLEYAAPDRYRLKNEQGPEIIIIGGTTYMQIGTKWQKMQLPADNTIGQMRTAFTKEGMNWISDVKYVGEEDVNGKAAYVYAYRGKAMYGIGENDSKLWVAQSDGLPIKIETTYRSGNMKSMNIEYDYSTPVTIEPQVN